MLELGDMYKSVWKCRLCGERFHTNVRYSGKSAWTTMVNLPERPLATMVHECFGGAMGVADFQGMERADGEV